MGWETIILNEWDLKELHKHGEVEWGKYIIKQRDDV